MRWFGRRQTQDTSLAVEQVLSIGEIGAPLPDVSLDDLMARLWIQPPTPEPALVSASAGVVPVASARASGASRGRPRKPRSAHQPRRRPSKLALQN